MRVASTNCSDPNVDIAVWDTIFRKKDESGLVDLQLMHYDIWRSSGWDIITPTGFLTYSHHNAGDLLTFNEGVKLGRVLIEHGAVLWVPPFPNSCLSLNGVSLQPTRTEVRAWYTCDTSANYYVWWPFHGP